jgi:hypothetical protein
MTNGTGKIIEKANCMSEAWICLENHFNRQRMQLENLLVQFQVLKTELQKTTSRC